MPERCGGARLGGRVAALALAALLVCLTGCPDRQNNLGPRPADRAPLSVDEALRRIERNFAGLQGVYSAKAVISLKFRDEEGKTRRYPSQDAALLYNAPQDLLVDMRSLSGTIAQFGSNEERYWVWIDPEVRTMWWGQWENADRVERSRLPVPATDLLDALLLRPLPREIDGGFSPVLRRDQNGTSLLYVRGTPDGRAQSVREVRLASTFPYMPTEIIDTTPDARVLMQAKLSNYQRVGDRPLYTPRRYVVTWPTNDAELRLDITSDPRLRPGDELEGAFAFPEWRGRVEALDSAPVSRRGPSAGELRRAREPEAQPETFQSRRADEDSDVGIPAETIEQESPQPRRTSDPPVIRMRELPPRPLPQREPSVP